MDKQSALAKSLIGLRTHLPSGPATTLRVVSAARVHSGSLWIASSEAEGWKTEGTATEGSPLRGSATECEAAAGRVGREHWAEPMCASLIAIPRSVASSRRVEAERKKPIAVSCSYRCCALAGSWGACILDGKSVSLPHNLTMFNAGSTTLKANFRGQIKIVAAIRPIRRRHSLSALAAIVCCHCVLSVQCSHRTTMASCAAVWSLYGACNATLTSMVLSASVAASVADASDDQPADPCATQLAEVYGMPLHVAAVFVVFLASLLGAGVPLLTKYHPGFAVDPYVVALGKCMGTGVVLACALVHMLQPASASLTSLCVPTAFNTDYTAYAFLFAMLAALAMQFMEFTLSAWLRAPTTSTETPTRTRPMMEVGTSPSPSAASPSNEAITFGCACDDIVAATNSPTAYAPLKDSQVDAHALLLQAVMIEFGVTVHSIFIVSVGRVRLYVKMIRVPFIHPTLTSARNAPHA